jgi:hypothetical protein
MRSAFCFGARVTLVPIYSKRPAYECPTVSHEPIPVSPGSIPIVHEYLPRSLSLISVSHERPPRSHKFIPVSLESIPVVYKHLPGSLSSISVSHERSPRSHKSIPVSLESIPVVYKHLPGSLSSISVSHERPPGHPSFNGNVPYCNTGCLKVSQCFHLLYYCTCLWKTEQQYTLARILLLKPVTGSLP